MNQELAVSWRKRLDDWSVSLLPLGNWCELNGVTRNQFVYWRRILSGASTERVEPQGGGWLACKVVDSVPVADPTGGVRVRVGRLTIEVEPGFHPATLRAVLQVLGADPC